ncbi:hypothetical protein ACFL04_03305 [Patescibacteria group bacterium]
MAGQTKNNKPVKTEKTPKSVNVRVLKNKKHNLAKTPKKITPPAINHDRRRLLNRLVIITAIVVLIFWALTLQVNLTKRDSGESLWSAVKDQVATIGDNISTLFKSISTGETYRPEDQYNELEEKVFPPLPASAQNDTQ